MEHEFHRWIKDRARTQTPSESSMVEIGVGDDAAVIRTHELSSNLLNEDGQANLVISTDTIAAGTHFETDNVDLATLQTIGRKLIAVNLSDLAAMAAIPKFATLNFQLPRSFDLPHLKALYEGCESLANQFNMTLVGGDTNTWAGHLVLSATVVGVRESTLSRWTLHDAAVGDVVLVSGCFGGSILGRHFSFEPRVELARYLATRYDIRAATDASDSLSIDLMAIANASDVSFEIDTESIPIAPELASFDRDEQVSRALGDGEDFELLMTTTPEVAEVIIHDHELPTPVVAIGRVASGPPGLRSIDGVPIPIRGYEH
ncbi:MAG: thiamine-phosphate kinase [Planctomycetota bacterium]